MRLELKIRYRKKKNHAKENLSRKMPRDRKKKKKKGIEHTARTESERREKGEETNQTRNSKLLFNFFFTHKLLTKLILALTST